MPPAAPKTATLLCEDDDMNRVAVVVDLNALGAMPRANEGNMRKTLSGRIDKRAIGNLVSIMHCNREQLSVSFRCGCTLMLTGGPKPFERTTQESEGDGRKRSGKKKGTVYFNAAARTR